MAFVLDCSVTMAWVFPDEATESTDRLRESRQPSGSCSGNETADRSEERLRGPEAGTSGPRDVPGSGGSNIFGQPAGGPPLSSARRRGAKGESGLLPGNGAGTTIDDSSCRPRTRVSRRTTRENGDPASEESAR